MWRPIETQFRESDDIEALKTRFIELCALYKINMDFTADEAANTPYSVGNYVFANHPGTVDPQPRGGIIGQHWAKELDVRERIRLYGLKGNDAPGSVNQDLYDRALQIASTADKDADRIKALELAAKLKGEIKKEAEGGGSGVGGNADLLALLAAKLPN